jgi:hypothetical protein
MVVTKERKRATSQNWLQEIEIVRGRMTFFAFDFVKVFDVFRRDDEENSLIA